MNVVTAAPIARAALPEATSVLAVVAHPDDESFGLGAVLAAFADRGAAVGGVCFTYGEASTLGEPVADLGAVRARELEDAAAALGVGPIELHGYPDGALSAVAVDELAHLVVDAARRRGADLLVAFDTTGITGHPDHRHATRAALAAAARTGLPLLAWTVPRAVACSLNGEFAASFTGRPREEVDIEVPVDRGRQLDAVRCHRSQSSANPVLWRRLELTAGREYLRWLCPAMTTTVSASGTGRSGERTRNL